MKLKDTTYNEKYPSFKLGKMDATGQGVPLNESVTIQLADHAKVDPVQVRTINYNNKNTGEAKSFNIGQITGAVVGDNVDNIHYNDFNNCNFDIGDKVAQKLIDNVGNLRGKTIEFKLVTKVANIPVKDEKGAIQLDADGKWVTTEKSYMTFDVSEITEDGSAKVIGESGSSDTSSPSPSVKVPDAIAKMNAEAGFELTEPEKAVFKEVRTNPEWKGNGTDASWVEFGKQGPTEFETMYNNVAANLSLPNADKERLVDLHRKFTL
mgnify:CR=1 FL=1